MIWPSGCSYTSIQIKDFIITKHITHLLMDFFVLFNITIKSHCKLRNVCSFILSARVNLFCLNDYYFIRVDIIWTKIIVPVLPSKDGVVSGWVSFLVEAFNLFFPSTVGRVSGNLSRTLSPDTI